MELLCFYLSVELRKEWEIFVLVHFEIYNKREKALPLGGISNRSCLGYLTKKNSSILHGTNILTCFSTV